jgi:2-keto-3-deoxy-L-fuconate dehydrogenase
MGTQRPSSNATIRRRPALSAPFKELRDGGGVDILVNHAGTSHVGTLEPINDEDLGRIFRVTVKGAFNCMFSCIPHMKLRRAGVILNIASIAGVIGLSDRFAYSMRKGAMLAMTYSVENDSLAYKIRCDSISPARIHISFVDG